MKLSALLTALVLLTGCHTMKIPTPGGDLRIMSIGRVPQAVELELIREADKKIER